MHDFWIVLTNLIQQYSIADTASVFSMIGGMATVVAAVGAIIAVVVTRKIAAKQIEISIEQNKISNKQAEIASQQNKIALLEKRASIYDALFVFMNHWYCFSETALEGLKKISGIDSLQAYISIREIEDLDPDYIKDKNVFELKSKHSRLVIEDAHCFSQTLRLFYLPNSYKATLVGVMEEYKKFSTEVHSLEYPIYSTKALEKIGNSI